MNIYRNSLLLGILFFILPAQAERPQIGLALAGGGAKGSAHIAVLELLEANNIPVDYIAGTSIGAYVAGLYALGYSAPEIKTIMYQADLDRGYSDSIDRQNLPYRIKQQKDKFNVPIEIGHRAGEIRFPGGLLYGQTMSSIYRSSVGNLPNFNSFDELAIPFRAVATDLATGEVVVLGSGNLVKAMQASATVPGILVPIELDGRYLVDGGLAENLPISQVKRLGADIIIAVDTSAPLQGNAALGNSISVLNQLTKLLTLRNIDEQKQLLSHEDIYIRPDIAQLSSTDFDDLPKAYEAGRTAAQNRIQQLQKLSIDDSDYRIYQQKKQEKLDALKQSAKQPVTRVILLNQSSISDQFLMKNLAISNGSSVSSDELVAAVNRVYALDRFERVDAHFELREEGRVLIVEAREKSWGPNYFEMGLGWEDDFTQDSIINLDFAYTRQGITRNNGEWRNEIGIGTNKRFSSEAYLPLGESQLFYLSARYEYRNEGRDFFIKNQPTAFFRLSLDRVNLSIGYNWQNLGLIEAGFAFERADYLNELSQQEDLRYDSPGIFVNFGFGTLDRLNFPTRGERLTLGITHWEEDVTGDLLNGVESTGEIYRSTQYLVDWKGAKSFGNHGLVGKTSFAHVESESEQSIHYTQLGGFLNLSGYHKNTLIGNSKAFAAIAYQYNLGRSLWGLSDFPIYLGASIEAGNVWLNSESIKFGDLIPASSIFISTDSKLGPVALGIGYADDDSFSVYFYLGTSI